jgi:hypothetical protein
MPCPFFPERGEKTKIETETYTPGAGGRSANGRTSIDSLGTQNVTLPIELNA